MSVSLTDVIIHVLFIEGRRRPREAIRPFLDGGGGCQVIRSGVVAGRGGPEPLAPLRIQLRPSAPLVLPALAKGEALEGQQPTHGWLMSGGSAAFLAANNCCYFLREHKHNTAPDPVSHVIHPTIPLRHSMLPKTY